MTKRELEYVLKLLGRIKDTDPHVAKAVAYLKKDLAQYEARRGQLREQYDTDYPY